MTSERDRQPSDSALAPHFCGGCDCGGIAGKSIGPVATTVLAEFERSEYNLVECTRCRSVFLDPEPSAADLHKMYQSISMPQFCCDHYRSEERVIAIVGYLTHSLNNHAMFDRPGISVLEVGAGLSWVSRTIKQQDSGARTVAQDISSEAAADCPWVDRYFVGPIEQLDRGESFDLIGLTHVIEHVPNPAAMLVELEQRLNVGGCIFLTAPLHPKTWQSGGELALWQDYSYLHVPAHLSYLNKAWFERNAARAGLVVAFWFEHEGGESFEILLCRQSELKLREERMAEHWRKMKRAR